MPLAPTVSRYVVRNATILPQNVFRTAVRVLKSNAYVRRELGGVQPGELKAYHIERGFVGFKDRRFRWFNPNVQMLFRINAEAPAGEAPVVAYVDAERTTVGLQLLNVSLLKAHPEHGFLEPEVVQIVGTDTDIQARDHLRTRLLTAKRSFLRSTPHPDTLREESSTA